jgi:hypothetical protein
MSKRLKIKEVMPGRTGNLTPRRQPISFASHRARIVCKPCNTHFGLLEEEVCDLIVPMATGRVLSLGDDSQELLALWASKTAIMLIAAHPDLREFVPQAHRDSVRYDERPHADSYVGYFPWRGITNIYAADDAPILGGVNPPIRLPGQAYSVVFTFKQLGFKVTGLIDPLPRQLRLGRDTDQIRQFWPSIPGLVNWPPTGGEVLGQGDFLALINFAPFVPV